MVPHRMFWPVAAVTVAVAVAVLATLPFRSPGEAQSAVPTRSALTGRELPQTEPEAPPSLVAIAPEVGAERSGAARTTAPCADCLDERAVLDVVKGYLWYVMPDYLGVRAERYLVSIPPDEADLERMLDAPRPGLPSGLADAPRISPFAMSVPRLGSPSEALETWIVWVQTGWQSYSALESLVERGRLPEVARSWPPLKRERYILVNARTGEISSVGGIRRHLKSVDPRGMNLSVLGREEARKTGRHVVCQPQPG